MNPRPWTITLCFLSVLVIAFPATAGDIDADISRGQFTGEGGYFEVGASLFAARSPVVGVPDDGDTASGASLTVSGRWQHGPGFVEIHGNDFNLGVNLWSGESWWFDALISQFHNQLDPDDIDALENSNLQEREADWPVGLRATGYLGDTLVQITFLSGDLADNHSGYSLLTEVGRRWQVRNNNFHWLVGAVYSSDNVTHYYFGVDPEQADANFPSYTADASMRLFAELGLTLALTEHWVMRGQARYAQLSSAIEDSPIIKDDYAALAAMSVSYVF